MALEPVHAGRAQIPQVSVLDLERWRRRQWNDDIGRSRRDDVGHEAGRRLPHRRGEGVPPQGVISQPWPKSTFPRQKTPSRYVLQGHGPGMVPRTYFLHGKLLHYFGGRRNLRTRFNSKVPNFLGRFYVGRAVPGGDSLLDPGKTRHGLVVELGRVEFKIQIAAGLHNAMNVFAAAAITISLTTDECVCCCNNYPLFMLLWSYFSIVLTDPGSVPPNWRPTVDEERDDVVPLTSSEFGSQILNLQQTASLADPANPRVRYCRKCNQLKPPRCHHCSVCGRCVLKMDHHCVWVVNCVGALNYKFFLLFLFYTFLETTLVTLSLLPQFIAFFSDGEIPGSPGTLATTFLAFVLNLAFAVSVLGFMIMHISLVSGNTTTIEAYEKKTTPKWRYDLGRRKNFEQVFGTDKKHWFIPSYSEEDLRKMPALQGLDYPSKPDLDAQEF